MRHSRDVGISFPVVFPKDGNFSAPVAPLSISGVGVEIEDVVTAATGISFLNITGMTMRGVDFPTDRPLMGPVHSFMVPLDLMQGFSVEGINMRFNAGLFGYYSPGSEINHGHLNRSLAQHYDLAMVRSDMSHDQNPGGGFKFGSRIKIPVNDDFGITAGGNYYIGSSSLDLEGSYIGFSQEQGFIESDVNFPDARLNYRLLELKVGVAFD